MRQNVWQIRGPARPARWMEEVTPGGSRGEGTPAEPAGRSADSARNGLTAGILRWFGAVAHPNGSIYGMPYSQTAILRITTPGSGAGSGDVLLWPFANGS